MSLSTDGFWKSGFWSTTFWADGFWFEGAFVPPVVTTETGGGGGGGKRKHKRGKVRYYSAEDEVREILEAPPTQAQLDRILARSTAPIDEEMEDDDDALLHAILAVTLQ